MEINLIFSRLATELLGDRQEEVAAGIREELHEFMQDVDTEFMHAYSDGDRESSNTKLYFVEGTRDGNGDVNARVRAGYYKEFGPMDKGPFAGKTVMMPEVVSLPGNDVFNLEG